MKTILTMAFCFFIIFSKAQTLTQSVNASAGGQFSTGVGTLDWTLGEVMTETYHQNNQYLTQGFHQPAIIIVTDVAEKPEMDMSLYPNPVRDFLTVKISQSGDYSVELYDLKGIKLNQTKVHVEKDPVEQQVNMQEFAVALYLLRITDAATDKTYSYRVEKIMKE